MDWLIRIGEWIKRRYFPLQHDSTYHPAETYYTSIYLELIERHLAQMGDKPLEILDAGCGTGRLLIPLAKRGHKLTGIDFHRDSLRLARRNATEAGTRVKLIDGDLLRELEVFSDDHFGALLAIESLYASRQLPEILTQLNRLLRQEGLLFVTHRTRYHYLLHCLAQGRLEDAYLVATLEEGRLPKGHHRIYYNWQSAKAIDALYKKMRMRVLCKHPIGPYPSKRRNAKFIKSLRKNNDSCFL